MTLSSDHLTVGQGSLSRDFNKYLRLVSPVGRLSNFIKLNKRESARFACGCQTHGDGHTVVVTRLVSVSHGGD